MNIQAVYAANTQIYTGKGVLTGVVISTNGAAGVPVGAYFTDGIGGGTNIFTVIVTNNEPCVIFFPDEFAPRFSTGLFLTVGANMFVCVWGRGM